MNIILLTGFSASGKSTLAKILGEKLEMDMLSVRALVDDITQRSGFERTRYWLADIGISKALEQLNEEIIYAIKLREKNNNGVIIDDLIDPKLVAILRDQFPEDIITVVAVKVDRKLRLQRVVERMGILAKDAIKELRFLDRIKQEAGLAQAMCFAEIEVENQRSIEEVTSELKEKLEPKIFHTGGVERE
mgnify:CR=1 FL=1